MRVRMRRSLEETTAAETTVVESAHEVESAPDVGGEGTEQGFARGDLVGRYLLIDSLGRGAMGRVLRAYDPDLDRQVAIKVLYEAADRSREQRDRLFGEAKAMARIGHANVVAVYDVGVHAGAVFIAMEIVHGTSLDRWLKTPRAVREILDVVIAAGRGLAAAHDAGVVHRDFKPANILVGTTGGVKVGDFGVAGIDARLGPERERDAPGKVVGTPAYMSPEHFAGAGVDARSDQFAFAITCFEALHGTRPFASSSLTELAAQVIGGHLAPAVATSRGGLDGVLRRALEREPQRRFETMHALIAALERARRPTWPRWVGGAVVAAVGALALGRSAVVDGCETGPDRVASVWNPTSRSALRIGGSEYSPAFAAAARARFEAHLDDYAARWALSYGDSCEATGPRGQRGTADQRAQAQCLENRLDSLEGLTTMASAEQLDPGRVEDLLATLPAIDECDSPAWKPYPADPDEAVRAAELHRRLGHVRRMRLLDRNDEILEDARRLVDDARVLGEPYLIASALSEYARLQARREDAEALLDEALELSLASGFDRLGATIINHFILVSGRTLTRAQKPELLHLVAMARGLVAHGGGDETLLGHLALNASNAMRHVDDLDRAYALNERAAEHYARVGHASGVAAARVNQLTVMLEQGRPEEAIAGLRAALDDFESSVGASSPSMFSARQISSVALSHAGRAQEAYLEAGEAYRRARVLFTPSSYSLQRAAIAYGALAANVDEADAAGEALATLRETPSPSQELISQLDLLEAQLLQNARRHPEALRVLAVARGRDGNEEARHWIEVNSTISHLALGRLDDAQRSLTSPELMRRVGSRSEDEELRCMVVFLAAVGRLAAPVGTTWDELRPAAPSRPTCRSMLDAIDALRADDMDRVRTIRDETTARYHASDSVVQLLELRLGEAPR